MKLYVLENPCQKQNKIKKVIAQSKAKFICP